jgi:signal transduction histidine kinase
VKVFLDLYRQRQQLREQMTTLTDTLRMNEMFIAILSHDLRNPLNAVLTGAELLLRVSNESSTHGVAERIRSSGRRMARLVSDVLDMARSRVGGGMSLSVEEVDLAEVIRRVVAEHPAESGIGVELKGDLCGTWDPGRLAQALSNLLGNALQHGTAGERIEVLADGSAPSFVRLSVSNAGRIPSSRLESLFDPFGGRDPRANPESGLGLGLYIVNQIVLAHDGSIELRQDDPERVRFELELPRRPSGKLR